MITIKNLLTLVVGFLLAVSAGASDLQQQLDKLKLPPGFSISLYSDQTPGARSLSISPSGVLYAGTFLDRNRQNIGKVYAIVDRDKDGVGETVHTLAEGLNMPNGVAWKDGDLYIAELTRIVKIENVENDLSVMDRPVVIRDGFPDDFMHGWKYLRFGPDGNLYVPLGAPCNVCDRLAEGYSSLNLMSPDGRTLSKYATGIRNTVGFDWHPQTGELWFTDNGRDGWGDDRPGDELNRAYKSGLHFGYPFCHQGDLPDPDFGRGIDCRQFEPPVALMGPHVAALGMRFYTGSQFPADYQNQPVVALHGSWNRSREAGHTGYKIVVPHLDNDHLVSMETLVEGWLEKDNSRWGRPVDIEMAPDGSVYISDDFAGAIYKLSYKGL